MADLPISNALALDHTTIAAGDLLPVLDVSAPSGSRGSKITLGELAQNILTGGAATALTSLGLRSTGAAYDLTLASNEALTAGRTLSFNVGDSARTLTLTGNATLSGVTITGAGTIATGGYTLTVPGTGTAALLSGTQTFTAANVFSVSGAASTPGVKLTGSWFTGGTSTTTMPQLLVETSGTTSGSWSTSGTAIGINAPSGFTGHSLSIQKAGVEQAFIRHDGLLHTEFGLECNNFYNTGGGTTGGYGVLQGVSGLFSYSFQINGPMAYGLPQSLSGAGAVNLTTSVTKFTSTGTSQSLTLADGTDGQVKMIVHVVAGGTGVLTPTTKKGFTSLTFNSAGDTAVLLFNTSIGWTILSIKGTTVA